MKQVADILSKKKRLDFWEVWVKKQATSPRRIALMIKKKEELADHDTLTEVLNRRGFLNYLSLVAQLLCRSDQKMALMFVDIDKLKKINDTKGHSAGDKLIVHVAECLKNSIRVSDFIGRWGGDEFIVVLTGAQDRETIAKIIKRTILCLTRATSITIGVAFWDKKKNPLTLIEVTDQAMYKAKKAGRGKVFFVNEG